MFEVKVTGNFAAAHFLREYKGKCENLHGHNYRVDVTVLAKKLNKTGLAVDFGNIKKELEPVLDMLDHKFLNDLPYFKKNNPSAENIAMFIFNSMGKGINKYGVKLAKITVWETEKSRATYSK